MSTTTESLFTIVINKFHSGDVRKRKKTVLFKDVPQHVYELFEKQNWNPASARINKRNLTRILAMLSSNGAICLIIKLILYLYVLPFLKYAGIVFLLLFRFYHYQNPAFISSRLNTSLFVRSVWSNYYINTVDNTFLSYSNFTNNLSNSTLSITSTATTSTIYKSNSKSATNTTSRITNINSYNNFYGNISKSKLLLSTKDYVIAFHDPTPLKERTIEKLIEKPIENTANKVIEKQTKKVSLLQKQIHISKPTKQPPNEVLGTKKKDKNTKYSTEKYNSRIFKKQIIDKIKEYRKYRKSENYLREYSNDYITGFILIKEKLAVVIEDGNYYVYAVSDKFLKKYL